MRSPRRRLAAALLALGVLSGSAMVVGAGVVASAAPPAATSPSPLCAYRSRIPDWFWEVLTVLFPIECGAPATTTTSTTRVTPTSAPPPTTGFPTTTTSARPPVSQFFRVSGVISVITCAGGTVTVPVGCGPRVRTAGQVRINSNVYATAADGSYSVLTGPPGPALVVQAVFPTPEGRLLDCPTITLPGGGGVADVVCFSFPAA